MSSRAASGRLVNRIYRTAVGGASSGKDLESRASNALYIGEVLRVELGNQSRRGDRHLRGCVVVIERSVAEVSDAGRAAQRRWDTESFGPTSTYR